MTSSNRTFLKPSRRRWCPPHMSQPPYLNPATKAGPVKKQSALLVNPFYPKDPNASFGKHVPIGLKKTVWSVPRSIFLRPIRRRRCFDKWKPRVACCIETGLCTTQGMRYSALRTCHQKSWSKAMPGFTDDSFPMPQSGSDVPKIGARSRRI